jgi:hypothetical protein
MRNKNNRKWYGFFSILAYAISTMASITFVWGLIINKMELIQLSATCILFMAGAWFTLKEAYDIRKITQNTLPDGSIEFNISYKHSGTSRACFIGLYIICTLFSVFTTANMAFQAINRDSDYKVKNSDTYKNIQASSTLSQSSIAVNNTDIASLLEEKKQAVKTQMAQVDKWKRTAVSQRQKEIDRANKIASEYDSRIAKIRADNERLQGNITTAISPTDVAITSKQKTLMDMFPDINFDKAVVIVILILGVGVDLLGAFFTVQYQKEMYFYYNGFSTPPTNEPETHGTLSTSRKGGKFFKRKKTGSVAGTMAKNVVPFEKKLTSTKNVHVDEKRPSLTSASFQEFTGEEIKAYLNEMYRTRKKNGDSIGFGKIGENIGIDKKKAEKIKGHLEMLGIVKSVQNRTIILKEAQ